MVFPTRACEKLLQLGTSLIIFILILVSIIYIIALFIRYNIIEQYTPDAFKYLLDEIHKLETELGLLPQKWKVLWDKLEVPATADSLKV